MKKFSNLKASAAPVALGLAMVSAMSTPAFAQDAAAEEDEGNTIVVTGSRIVRPEVESVSPVTSIGAEEIDNTGVVRVEDLVNSLPQTVAAQTAFVSNGASGTATINLRGLGTLRTLVLVDGRRLPQGDPFATAPDINQIPAQLIERVEIVTGGASSIYGADAVAGVVNFIMDRDFEGFKLDAGASFYQHNNDNSSIRDLLNRTGNGNPGGNQVSGFTYDVNASFGASFDDGRGHVTAYAGYRQIEAIVQADYDTSACALTNRASDPTGFFCAGSSTTPDGTFFVTAPGPGGLGQGGTPASGIYTLTGGNNFRDSQAFSGTGIDTYNYAPTNYFQRPDKRWTAGFFADYEISDAVKPYAEFQYMDDRSVAQIAFSGTFFTGPGTLGCNNALLSAQQANTLGCTDTSAASTETVGILIGKRLVEGFPRQNDLRHTSYRAVVGMKGNISDNWSYDVYGLRGNTIYQNTYLNDLSITRINAALAGCPGTGEPAGCVPLNLFQQGGVDRAQFNYISVNALQNADLETYVVSGYVTGALGDAFGAGDVGVVFGAEYRKEQYALRVDENFQQGNLSGQGGPTPPTAGDFSVKELFTEINIPIVDDTFIHSLSVEGGYRFSDYSSSGTTHTFKVGVNFAPVEAIKFRGVFNRAVRAPNVVELFSPQSIGLFGGVDPCTGATPTASAAQCAFTGISAAQYGTIAPNPANQYNQLGGGNPNLGVEESDSWTAGVVIDGNGFGLPGFTASVDYFNIELTGAIQGIGAQFSLNACAGQNPNITAGDPRFCNLVNRDGNGSLWLTPAGFVTNTQQNIGGLKTEGLDFGMGYNYPLASGSLYLDLAATYTFENSFENIIGLGATDCVGQYGNTCGQPQPDYRHRLRFGYRADSGWNVNFGWRYYGKVDFDGISPTAPTPADTLPAYSWFDLSGSVDIGENFTFTGGVNNLLDKDPPIIGGQNNPQNGNTFPGVYDPVGRQFFVRGSLKF